jgi:hypothetical protein
MRNTDVQHGSRALRGNPNAVVVAGGVGWAQGAPNVSSTTWYQGLYAAGARTSFDAANTHPYYDYSGVTSQEMGRSL